MPRAARTVVADYPLHITQRGINGSDCFFSESDYRTYLRYLAESARRFGCSVHAYCLMTNHVHLLLTPHEKGSCARLMKHVGQCYVQTVNFRLGRRGTLWEGRFHSSLVMSDSYLIACYRYIERNPVRARMVHAPQDYPWSSHRSNAGHARDGWIIRHEAFQAIGFEAYKEMCSAELAPAVLEEIRKATRLDCAMGAQRRRRGRPRKKMGTDPISEK